MLEPILIDPAIWWAYVFTWAAAAGIGRALCYDRDIDVADGLAIGYAAGTLGVAVVVGLCPSAFWATPVGVVVACLAGLFGREVVTWADRLINDDPKCVLPTTVRNIILFLVIVGVITTFSCAVHRANHNSRRMETIAYPVEYGVEYVNQWGPRK